jgi:hypothetical protein
MWRYQQAASVTFRDRSTLFELLGAIAIKPSP